MAQRFATYLRRSSVGEEDKNYSIDDQRKHATDYGLTRGWEHVEEYSDPGGKSYKLNRPVLQRLMRDAKDHKFDVVVVGRWDRFSRVQEQAMVARYQLRQHGVTVLSATQSGGEGPVGTFMDNAHMFAAELELYNIRERLMGGRLGRTHKGKILTAPYPLHGYVWGDPEKGERSYYIEDPEAAPTVRLIYTLTLSGMTLRGLAAKLEHDGIPTPMQLQAKRGRMPKKRTASPVWRLATLSRILTNPAYCGRHSAWRHERQTLLSNDPVTGEEIELARFSERHEDDEERVFFSEAVCPALVTPEQFAQVQTILDQRKAHSKRNLRDSEAGLLRGGIAVCGYCGRNMQLAYFKDKGYYQYYCSSQRDQHKGSCPGGCFYWRSDTLDCLAWAWLCQQFENPDLLRARYAEWCEHQDSGESIEHDQLSALEEQIKRARRRRENNLASMADAEDEEDRLEYKGRAEAEKRTISLLEGDRDRLAEALVTRIGYDAQVDSLVAGAERTKENVAGADFESKRFALRAFAVRVEVKRKPEFVWSWALGDVSVPNQWSNETFS